MTRILTASLLVLGFATAALAENPTFPLNGAANEAGQKPQVRMTEGTVDRVVTGSISTGPTAGNVVFDENYGGR